MKKLLINTLILLFTTSQALAVSPMQQGYAQVISRIIAGGAPVCAGGSSGELGTTGTSYQSTVGDYQCVYTTYTAGSANDGSVTVIHVDVEGIDTDKYVSLAVWSISGTTATVEATTSSIVGSGGYQALDSSISSICLEDGTVYAIGLCTDDTSFRIRNVGYAGGKNIYSVSAGTPGSISGFDTGSASVVNGSDSLVSYLNNSLSR